MGRAEFPAIAKPVLRRVVLMMRVRKFRFIFQSIFHGFECLTLERLFEFPAAVVCNSNKWHDARLVNPAAPSLHISQA